MGLLQLLRVLDARLVEGTASRWPGQCPVCGCGTELGPDGTGRACLQCSLAGVGETWPGLAHRVSHHLTKAQWDKLETIEDVPRYRYREWIRKFMR
jgi:hypothetical protein